MKRDAFKGVIKLSLLFALTLFAAGCGHMSGTGLPYYPPTGNLEGYVYQRVYNEGSLGRLVLRTSRRDVPTGYTPVKDATVAIPSESLTTTTDADGKFYFANLAIKTYTVQVSKNGQTTSFNVTVVANTTTVSNDAAANGDNSLTLAPPQAGTLSVAAAANCVASIPAEAYVYIKAKGQQDFYNTGVKTPLAVISDITPGTYTVYVSSPDYETPPPSTAVITANAQTNLMFTLAPKGGNFAPYAQIASPADGASFEEGTTVIFSGSAADCEDGNIASSGLVWKSSINGPIGTGAAIQAGSLSVGAHTITFTATDSGGKISSDSISVVITPASANTAPTAAILSPQNNSSYSLNATITFIGGATDTEDGTLTGSNLVWKSNIDGQIGTGTLLQVNTLSPGNHTITLTATDSRGGTGSASVKLTVKPTVQQTAPTANILIPADNAVFYLNDTITFTGAGNDAEDGILPAASLSWSSSIDGQLGTGSLLQLNDLSAGTHTITLAVVDSDSMGGVDTITITVRPTPSQNTAPTVVIAFPINNSTMSSGAPVLFAGTATDTQDGVLTGSSLVWSSSINGQLNTGTNFSKSNLAIGTHIITLTATDKDGAKGTATTTVKIN